MLDKLSALIAAMNDKYGADLERRRQGLGRPAVARSSRTTTRCATVALNNDRSQYELVLESKVKEFLVDRHEKNGQLFDLFFSNPDFQMLLLNHLSGTYDEFQAETPAS